MATEFDLSIEGSADADVVREAFETAVRAIRSTLDEGAAVPSGLLLVGGDEYDAEDVPEAEEFDDDESADDGSPADDGETDVEDAP